MKIRKAMLVSPFLLLASGVLAQNAPQPETTISYRPPADPAASWSSYDRTKAGPLFAEATIEGRRAAVMVDTGVTFTTLDLGWIKQFSNGAEAQPTLRVAATGGTTSAALGPVVELSLPSYDVHRLQTLAADFSGFKSALSRPVDMALGMNVIGVGSLELDLGAGHWRFAPTGIRWPQAATARLLYTPDRYHSYIVIDIEGHVLRLGVDTGYDGGLMLTKNAATITGLFDRNPTTTVASAGLGGIAISTLAVPTKMKFGVSELSNIPTEIEADGGLPTQWKLDGLIGIDLLRQLHAVLDFPASTFFYLPSTEVSPAPVRATIGIQSERKDGAWRIIHVMANSPAAEAGWKSGERICAVSRVERNKTIPQGTNTAWGISAPGTKLKFQICDGSIRRLTARNFY